MNLLLSPVLAGLLFSPTLGAFYYIGGGGLLLVIIIAVLLLR
jgi:hypothetical protein